MRQLHTMARLSLEYDLPIVEGSETLDEMRDLLSTLMGILISTGLTEAEARAAIEECTENQDLKALLNGTSQAQVA